MPTKVISSVIVLLLLSLSYLYFLEIKGESSNLLYSDYGKFYLSGRFAAKHESLYTTVFITEPKANDPASQFSLRRLPGNLNPPFFQLLVYPFSFFSYLTSLNLWLGLIICCGIVSICAIPRILNIRNSLYCLIIGAALFAYYPTLINVQFGQVSLLLLPLVLLAWWAARNNKLAMMGIALGVAINIKIFFGLFALYFLIRREWRGLLWFGISAVFCALIPLLFFKTQNYLDYHLILHQIKWYSSSWNPSIFGFLLRLFGGEEKNVPLIALPYLTNILYWISASLLLVALIRFLLPTPKIDPQKKCDLDFCLIIIGMLLLSPLSWIYYFPLLFVPFIVLFNLIENNELSFSLRLLTCSAVILSSMPTPLLMPYDIKNSIDILFMGGFYTYALVLLLIILFKAKSQLASPNSFVVQHLPKKLIVLLYVAALFPSLIGMLGTGYHLLLNPHSYMPAMVICNKI